MPSQDTTILLYSVINKWRDLVSASLKLVSTTNDYGIQQIVISCDGISND